MKTETNVPERIGDGILVIDDAPTILVVDDSPVSLAALSDLLVGPGYRVLAATDGPAALRCAALDPHPDLILMDIRMPGMDGYEVLARLRANPETNHVPVVFLTALGEATDEARGLALGAADYMSKPISAPLVLARVRTQLDAARARQMLRAHNARLEVEVTRRMEENEITQAVSIRALAHLAETRDPETGNHILRTQAYVTLLATELRSHPKHGALLTPHYIELLARSAPLHDIGKVGIPDRILLKPGKLDEDEWAIMKTHAAMGARAIELAEIDADREVEFLRLAKEIAHWHHERWDGTGYPDGLAGDEIPFSARLMALADVFDALVSPRVYKAPMNFERACKIIVAGSGRHFDPDVVSAFRRQLDAFREVAVRYAENDR